MKKIMVGLLLALSVMAVANGRYDYIEDKLEFKYRTLTDNKNNSLEIEDIEVGSFNNKIYINMEIESFAGDGGWGKFDKDSYDNIAKSIADEVRSMLNSNEKVEITLILEKEIGKDRMLHSGNY